jgi:hypothetical protein
LEYKPVNVISGQADSIEGDDVVDGESVAANPSSSLFLLLIFFATKYKITHVTIKSKAKIIGFILLFNFNQYIN